MFLLYSKLLNICDHHIFLFDLPYLFIIIISFGDSSNFMVTFNYYLVEMDRKNKVDRIQSCYQGKFKRNSRYTKRFRQGSCIIINIKILILSYVSVFIQSCPILCDPVDCSLPDSSVHGILQARILEWVAISFSRGPSRPRDC